MKRIGIIANTQKSHAHAVLKRLADKAKEKQLQVLTSSDAAPHLPGAEQVAPEALAESVDVILALGGDGTMLHAVRLIDGADTPVLGVNLGSLGFMTSVTEDELEHAIDVLVTGDYTISERSLLSCQVQRDGGEVAHFIALNDIVVGWGHSSRALTLALSIDDEEVAQYLCDGLIVATPTGSTGHSLSAGGPIVHPHAPVFNVNVICPHTLSARPLVLPDQSAIAVQVSDIPHNKRPLLSADGQGELELAIGDTVHIRRHPHCARFIHLPEYSYFSVLRQKLHWRGSAR